MVSGGRELPLEVLSAVCMKGERRYATCVVPGMLVVCVG